MRQPTEPRPVTFEAASDLGAFELASRWADRLSWPMPLNRSASDDLAELACMSALAQWLVRWKPIQLHRAVLAGARGPADLQLTPVTGQS